MRRGSLEFWPHRRAKKIMPRVRTWPYSEEPKFLGLVAFKAGMTHIGMMDDSEAPSKGSEIITSATVLEVPRIFVYGIRLYKKRGDNEYKETSNEFYSKDLAISLGIKKTENVVEKLSDIKSDLSKFVDVSALMYLDASPLGFGNKRKLRFEVGVGGKDIQSKIEFAEKWLGKEVKLFDVFADGDYIDTISVSKGKGWAGVIKRFGVARQVRKATGKVRHVGTLGPWHPPKVTYMVPMSGHMGFNYRTEINKRVLRVSKADDIKSINVKGGFPNYGIVKSDFLIVKGSVAGPSKRLIRLRKAIRPTAPAKKPELTYISIESKQGA